MQDSFEKQSYDTQYYKTSPNKESQTSNILKMTKKDLNYEVKGQRVKAN